MRKTILPTFVSLDLVMQGISGFGRYEWQTPGVATEIMGTTPEGWIAIEQMEKVR